MQAIYSGTQIFLEVVIHTVEIARLVDVATQGSTVGEMELDGMLCVPIEAELKWPSSRAAREDLGYGGTVRGVPVTRATHRREPHS